jgi:ribosomal protein L11 methyltransferase
MNYVEVNTTLEPYAPWNEILISRLAEIGFESFTETANTVQAYIQEDLYSKEATQSILEEISSESQVKHTVKLIPYQNWNAAWEAEFKPVEVENQLYIRAPFHPKNDAFAEEIIIQPQMSFGTGHHQTTWLLSKTLMDIDFADKTVLDVGTGTGVLAILAKKRGARFVLGTDIEQVICQNARDNCKLNHIHSIEIRLGDIDCVTEQAFDIIIANINKNVLKQHMKQYAELSKPGGFLFLSGFFANDVQELHDCATDAGYKLKQSFEKDNWAVMCLEK